MRLLSQPVITADEVKATLMILSTTKYLWTLLYQTEIANPQQHPWWNGKSVLLSAGIQGHVSKKGQVSTRPTWRVNAGFIITCGIPVSICDCSNISGLTPKITGSSSGVPGPSSAGQHLVCRWETEDGNATCQVDMYISTLPRKLNNRLGFLVCFFCCSWCCHKSAIATQYKINT